jgi:pSer/pThr/pTyr-binding forkhead associated (FHA) protein
MSTHTPFPQTRPAPHDPPTEPLEPAAIELELDGFRLLDHRSRELTIAPRHALRGPYLAFEDGDETRLLRLSQAITHVGRGTEAEVRLDEHHVSRDHAILVRHGRHVRLLDNRSSNGTFVNGRRAVATNIVNGDVITLGPVRFHYVEIP